MILDPRTAQAFRKAARLIEEARRTLEAIDAHNPLEGTLAP